VYARKSAEKYAYKLKKILSNKNYQESAFRKILRD
jgi:hypothetical protein